MISQTINASTRAQSCKLSMSQLGHNLQLIRLEQGRDNSLAAIKAESLLQLSIFLQIS